MQWRKKISNSIFFQAWKLFATFWLFCKKMSIEPFRARQNGTDALFKLLVITKGNFQQADLHLLNKSLSRPLFIFFIHFFLFLDTLVTTVRLKLQWWQGIGNKESMTLFYYADAMWARTRKGSHSSIVWGTTMALNVIFPYTQLGL